jgi:Sporulation and spore germination
VSMRIWWLAFFGGLAILVIIAVSIARMYGPPRPAPLDAPPANAPSTPKETAHITATLFFGSPDGKSLVPVRRDVPLAATVVEQGRQILTSQLAEAPPEPYVSVIPSGTMLRAFYVTERGDAFVDLSSDVVRGHPGGSLNELLTIYAIVNAVTANLPAARRVQILVDGKEADTLAGHVDLRRPLTRDDSLVREADKK